LPIAVIDRFDPRRAFRGLVEDFGLRRGAVAWSTGWESTALGVVGATARESAQAIERLVATGGGIVVIDGEHSIAEWRAELGGHFTRSPLPRIASDMQAVNDALEALGCPWLNGAVTLEALTSGAVPFLRISPAGYVRVKDGQRVDLPW
jgi:adenine deaminase